MKILGIETSCDETSAAVISDDRHVLSNVISSQIKTHQHYGGIVPEIASRMHAEAMMIVLESALSQAQCTLADIDLLSVTRGPGLIGALMVGVATVKALSFARHIPFVGVHHIEGHIYANELDQTETIVYPALALVISGGHTQLVVLRAYGDYQLLGTTLDDAVGEAFDKTARHLGLGYPGGPAIDLMAKKGDPKRYVFPKTVVPGVYNFSFSGLKTAAIQLAASLDLNGVNSDDPRLWDFVASFQYRIVDTLLAKTIMAAKDFSVKTILLAGGVAANSAIRAAVLTLQEQYHVVVPPMKFCTDNGAMVALAGLYAFLHRGADHYTLAPRANVLLTDQ